MLSVKSAQAATSSVQRIRWNAMRTRSISRCSLTGGNFETWLESGAEDATKRANRIFSSVLAQYEPSPLDDGAREALNAFIDKRIAEGGAPIN